METIKTFKDEHRFLSNFTHSPIMADGLTYPTVEHYFQAMKSTDPTVHSFFAALQTPGMAKKEGRMVKMRSDWEFVKIEVMRQALRLKFGKNHPALRVALLETGNAVLEEGNVWGDTFYGIDIKTGEGENHLGKLLMEIRQEILNQKL